MNDDRTIDITQPTDVYTIAHFPYGIAIRGDIPQHLFAYLTGIYSQMYHYDICDSDLADTLNASVVLTTRDKSNLWRHALGLKLEK